MYIYTHTCIHSDRDTHDTPTETGSRTCMCANTHVHSLAVDVFTKSSLCKPNKRGSSAIYFQPRRRFSVSLLPLSSSQSFLKVHICQWFVNQPAKFTTLRSNVFLFLVVLHVNLACWRGQRRKICKAVKITPPFTWCWKRPFHSFIEQAGREVFIYAGEKMNTKPVHAHTLNSKNCFL